MIFGLARLFPVCFPCAVDSFLEHMARTYPRMPCDDQRAILRAYADDSMREFVDDGGLRKVA